MNTFYTVNNNHHPLLTDLIIYLSPQKWNLWKSLIPTCRQVSKLKTASQQNILPLSPCFTIYTWKDMPE